LARLFPTTDRDREPARIPAHVDGLSTALTLAAALASPWAQITAANAADLRLVWTVRTGDVGGHSRRPSSTTA
jgi:glucose dehydrogenase